MTPRQQRRLEQKVARKAAKKQHACAPTVVEALVPALEAVPDIAAIAPSGVAGASMPDSSAEFAGHAPAVAGPVSEARLLANRANAQLSRGPVTTTGKQIVSQNAMRHGLTGKFQVLPGESQADFDQMLAGFMRAEAPADQEEVEFVQQMAQSMWLSSRSVRMQDQCILAMQSGTPEEQKKAEKSFALYLRYMSTHERTFIRFSTELRKRRNERRKAERDFVSQKLREAAELRREANETRKKEVHDLRQVIANCRRERLEIQNRLAEAKVESAKTLAAAA
ncbi:MAG TPA: hypothetical protein VH302_13630 [Bryobacteraceae bacterium]|nr:hypothetical protein [Bryobacteraceae bacterium]